MKVTFIQHSCFVVELTEVILVFDYFFGDLPQLDPEKTILFFASHKHADHFSIEIFKIAKSFKKVKFILSKDIRCTDKFLTRHGVDLAVKEHIIWIGKEKEEEISAYNSSLFIKTLTSTDEGVAFLVECEGKKIYHAGDLHWWSWSGSSEDENNKMEQDYKREINKLRTEKIDISFVVLDPRLEERYWWGMDYYLKVVETGKVFPMHSWDKLNLVKQFKKDRQKENYNNRVIEVLENGQSFEV